MGEGGVVAVIDGDFKGGGGLGVGADGGGDGEGIEGEVLAVLGEFDVGDLAVQVFGQDLGLGVGTALGVGADARRCG